MMSCRCTPFGPVRWAPPTRMPARLSFRRLPETRTPLEATTSTACCVLSVITFCETIVLELISISIPTVLPLTVLLLMTSPVESSSVQMPGAPFPVMRLSVMVTSPPTVLIPPASNPARATPTPFPDTVLPSTTMSVPPPPMPSRPLSRTLQPMILIPGENENATRRVLPHVEPLEPPG